MCAKTTAYERLRRCAATPRDDLAAEGILFRYYLGLSGVHVEGRLVGSGCTHNRIVSWGDIESARVDPLALETEHMAGQLREARDAG